MKESIDNLEGPPPTPEERAAMARELDAVAPTPGDKFALMRGQRPTPRTDAFYGCPPPSSGKQWQTKGTMEELYFARQLERELAEALETLSMAINSANARQAETEHARRRLAEAREEGEEQARLLGMSGEREAGLLAEIDRLKRELAETVACMRLAEAATIRALHERNEARGQKWRLAEACRWAQRELGKHTRPSPIDKALDSLKGGSDE